MPGLVPGIQVFFQPKNRHGQDKPGHAQLCRNSELG